MSQTMEQMDGGSLRESEEPEKKQKSRRPPNTAFRQQRLKAWQPILTPKTVIPLFLTVGVLFCPIGGLLLWASSQVQELIIDYSLCNTTAPACESGTTPPGTAFVPADKVTSYFKNTTEAVDMPTWCKSTTNDAQTFGGARNLPSTVCHIQFYIPDQLAPPVLLYYRLTNFYQNHRRYVKSFDQDQLQGTYRSASQINSSDCDPLEGEYVASEGVWKPYYPCGLIANSRFNDTIQKPVLLNAEGGNRANNVTYNMTSNGTAWPSDAALYGADLKYSYGEVLPPPNWREVYPAYNTTYPFPDLHADDAFQVWMRTAGLPTFSKMALRNDHEVMARGRYQIDVYDYFPVNLYDGTKSLLISTRTIMGGRNPFLGIAFLVVGGLCIALGALFTVTQLVKPRKLGDHSYLSWSTEQPSTATTTGRAPRPGEGA
ncbi:hypothetical protein LTR85_006545 [Meristemomyces frigidus]|nr:hypothetical protein LTR85_006545 [Meristemomyces frigidus]